MKHRLVARAAAVALLAAVSACDDGVLAPVSRGARVSGPIDFGTSWVGRTSDRDVDIVATGQAHVRVLRVVTDHDDLTVQHVEGLDIAPGAPGRGVVRWLPADAGEIGATVRVET